MKKHLLGNDGASAGLWGAGKNFSRMSQNIREKGLREQNGT